MQSRGSHFPWQPESETILSDQQTEGPGMTRQHRIARHFIHAAAYLAAALMLALVTPIKAITPPNAPPPFNGIAHVAIRVHDLTAATAFYEQLGFEQAFALSRNGAVYESFIKINDRQFLELYPTTEKDPTPGFLHLCFEGADLEAIHADYVSRGLTPRSDVRKAGAGNLLFTMDGPVQPAAPQPGPQNIEYTQYQPGSMHTLDQGKHLGSDRIADKLVTVTLAMQDPAAARDFYLNQLEFKSLPGNPMAMHLPGDSGEVVEIVPAPALGNKARITLQTENLGKAARILHKQHIAATKINNVLTITDPDGNTIRIAPR